MLEVSAFVCMELNPNQQKPDAGRDDGVTFAEMIRNSTCGLLATGTCWESVGNKGISSLHNILPYFLLRPVRETRNMKQTAAWRVPQFLCWHGCT